MLDHCMDRICHSNLRVNALESYVQPEELLDEANMADTFYTQENKNDFEDKPLMGIPMTIKSAFVDQYLVLVHLRKMGAVYMGKTLTPKNITGQETASPEYGITRNPLDLRRTPGGSSGGSAAAIAAGYSLLEWGSDSGGSILLPCAMTGITGMRCTKNLFPVQGHGKLPLHLHASPEFLSVGPMAKCPKDIELVLGCLRTSMNLRWRFQPCYKTKLSEFRVAHMFTKEVCPLDDEVTIELTGELERLNISHLHPTHLIPEIFFEGKLMGITDIADAMYKLWRHHVMEDRMEDLEYLNQVRNAWEAWVRQTMREYDLILIPICPVVAPFCGDTLNVDSLDYRDSATIQINGNEEPYLNMVKWCTLFNACGLPIQSLPIGKGVHSNMPVGIGIVGRAFGDMEVARFASLMYTNHAQLM
jgi:amidase